MLCLVAEKKQEKRNFKNKNESWNISSLRPEKEIFCAFKAQHNYLAKSVTEFSYSSPGDENNWEQVQKNILTHFSYFIHNQIEVEFIVSSMDL